MGDLGVVGGWMRDRYQNTNTNKSLHQIKTSTMLDSLTSQLVPKYANRFVFFKLKVNIQP